MDLSKQSRPRSGCSLRSSLIRGLADCYTICIIWRYHIIVAPHSLNFRVVTVKLASVQKLWSFHLFSFINFLRICTICHIIPWSCFCLILIPFSDSGVSETRTFINFNVFPIGVPSLANFFKLAAILFDLRTGVF